MTDYNLTFSEQDLQIISGALGEVPLKFAAPLIEKINKQILEAAPKPVAEEVAAPTE